MMVEHHIIDPSEKVELLEGEIFVMTPQGKLHTYCVHKVYKVLEKAFDEGYFVINQSTMLAGRRSKPEPDIVVMKGSFEEYGRSHPEEIWVPVLAVEVADSSLDTDRKKKARIYAGTGIKDYWVLNLVHRQLEVFRDPEPWGDSWRYARVETVTKNVAPLERPEAMIDVSSLLP